MKKSIFKILLIIMPFLVILMLVRQNHQIPSSQDIINGFGSLPNLKDLLIEDLEDVKRTFQDIPFAFNFREWQFPRFDASSFGAFFGSIGAFFSSFGQNLGNTFTSLFSGLSAFFNAIGALLKCLGSTIINLINYLFGIFRILFS